MENNFQDAASQESIVDESQQENAQPVEPMATEKSEVTPRQFDPKEAQHGGDFCCGSCGG